MHFLYLIKCHNEKLFRSGHLTINKKLRWVVLRIENITKTSYIYCSSIYYKMFYENVLLYGISVIHGLAYLWYTQRSQKTLSTTQLDQGKQAFCNQIRLFGVLLFGVYGTREIRQYSTRNNGICIIACGAGHGGNKLLVLAIQQVPWIQLLMGYYTQGMLDRVVKWIKGGIFGHLF